jgi:uridine kinase
VRVRIIGIAGGSGSGKTTFARELRERLGAGRCAVLYQDSYYIDQSARFTGDGESVNFDEPTALDFPLLAEHLRALKRGESVIVPQYDFPTHKRLPEGKELRPFPVILLDGTLILTQPPICLELEASIFIDCAERVRFDRRFHRDLHERGRQPEGIRKQFVRQVKPMHDLHVQPSAGQATERVSGEEPFEAALERWTAQLRSEVK